jgi:hypothetical protein
MLLSIYTHLIKLDEDDEVGEDDAEYLHTPDQTGEYEEGDHGAEYLHT